MRVICWLFLFLFTAGAVAAQLTDAQQLAQRYPPGSITTREMADRAITDAASLHDRLQHGFEVRKQYCEHVFFVNRCLGEAHRVQRDGDREVRRITLEAHDLQRLLDARDRAQQRSVELQREAVEDLQRPERERQAMQAAQTRQQNAEARAKEDELHTQESAAKASSESERRQRDQAAQEAREEAARPQQEAESLREFQQKQEQAEEYAQQRARDREANAKRRAERQAAREQQNAAAAAAPAPAPAPSAH